ncbi:hypothetical protein P7C70_g9241, partial [Phenoliferia sp. Uapishka_3]
MTVDEFRDYVASTSSPGASSSPPPPARNTSTLAPSSDPFFPVYNQPHPNQAANNPLIAAQTPAIPNQSRAIPQADIKPNLAMNSDDIKPKLEMPLIELDLGKVILQGVQSVPPFEPGTYDPDVAMKKAKDLIGNIDILLSPKNFGNGGGRRLEEWRKEVEKLKEKITANPQVGLILPSRSCPSFHLSTHLLLPPPQFLIAVVGSTGAGKSSLINALLDSDALVPTNSMRACTAVVTEIAYNFKDDKIRAEVEFLTPEEWKAELAVLRDDLIDDDGRCRRVQDEASEAGAAWARIHSVYPNLHQNAEYET